MCRDEVVGKVGPRVVEWTLNFGSEDSRAKLRQDGREESTRRPVQIPEGGTPQLRLRIVRYPESKAYERIPAEKLM